MKRCIAGFWACRYESIRHSAYAHEYGAHTGGHRQCCRAAAKAVNAVDQLIVNDGQRRRSRFGRDPSLGGIVDLRLFNAGTRECD